MWVVKWGNSLVVCFLVGLVDEWGLCEGDEVEIVVYCVGVLVESCNVSFEVIFLLLRCFRGKLLGDFRFRWNDVNELD